MDEPISREPLEVCAVLIKEEPLETPEDADSAVKLENDDCAEDGSPIPMDAPDKALTDCAVTFSCEICTKQFLQKRYLIAHLRRHPEFEDQAVKLREEKKRVRKANKNQHFACSYCMKEFYDRSTVNRHMKIHTDDTPASKDFICHICEKAFTYKRDLRVHLRVHTGEKPFKCETCGKRFSQLATLQYHVKGHSDHKPFPCDLCTKQFVRRISLERHKRIHSGDRPFKCQLCEKAFTQRRHLVVHERIHLKKPKSKKTRSKFLHKDSDIKTIST